MAANGGLDLEGEQRNSCNIRCERCNSLIMLKDAGKYVKKEFLLPHMRKKEEEKSPEGETCQEFWVLKDHFDFENIGFTKDVGTIKYLICADCEVGPLGWHDTQVKDEFYVAISRVKKEQ